MFGYTTPLLFSSSQQIPTLRISSRCTSPPYPITNEAHPQPAAIYDSRAFVSTFAGKTCTTRGLNGQWGAVGGGWLLGGQ